MPRVLVIQPDDDTPIGQLGAPLRATAELSVWAPRGSPSPGLNGFDGIVALGSASHPEDDPSEQWIGRVRDLLRAALAAGAPTLGICLGGQLLSQAAGGTARPLGRMEIGWLPLELAPAAADDPLLAAAPAGARVLQWHHYGFTVPPGGALLATTGGGSQAFRAPGGRAWGIQFHVEADPALVEAWAESGLDALAAHGVDVPALRRETLDCDVANRALAADVAARFAALL